MFDVKFALLGVVGLTVLFRFWLSRRRSAKSVAVFHPNASSRGGGERVLWCLISSLLYKMGNKEIDVKKLVVYCDYRSGEMDSIIEETFLHFNIDLKQFLKPGGKLQRNVRGLKNTTDCTFQLIYLRSAWLMEAETYSRLTIALQIIGSMITGLEAVIYFSPMTFIETQGFSFASLAATYLCGSVSACYIHYPTVSYEVISALESQLVGIDVKLRLRIFYYKMIFAAYRSSLLSYKRLIANSLWTRKRINSIINNNSSLFGGALFTAMASLMNFFFSSFWNLKSSTSAEFLYPPVDVVDFSKMGLSWENRKNRIVSVAQFRPEKLQEKQIESFGILLREHADMLPADLSLSVCGSVRDSRDQKVLDRLKEKVTELNLESKVNFHVDLPFQQLKALMCSSKVGLHTMEDEHFGIAVVEMLAAGLIVVAHNSGGPAEDILNPPFSNTHDSLQSADKLIAKECTQEDAPENSFLGRFGYLCTTDVGFAASLKASFLSKNKDTHAHILKNASASLLRFPNSQKFGMKALELLGL